MGNELAGKVALVTGASRGIGKAIATRYAAEGAAVAICSRPNPGIEQLGTLEGAAADVRAVGGGPVLAVPFDLGDPANDVSALVDRVEQELGPVDVLVNNAAAGGYKAFADWSDRSIERVLQVNFWAPWHLVARVLPGMRERGSGWIINVSSASAKPPTGPPFPPTAPAATGTIYGGTKAFLDRWTASLAAEVWEQGIAVNTLAPQAAAATEVLVEYSDIPAELYEPLDTMAEAALLLATADPAELTGRITYSLELLAELDRPTLDLTGASELAEWAPGGLTARIELMQAHARGTREGAGRSNVADLGSRFRQDG